MEFENQVLIKFAGDRVLLYSEAVNHAGKRIYNGKNLAEDRKKTYKGELSKNCYNRVQEKLLAWCYSIKQGNKSFVGYKGTKGIGLIMITLTLSGVQRHTDSFMKRKMLELFIKWLQYNYGVENYFWRVESQENGNIHFHILIDKFIPMRLLQIQWNKIQDDNGYLEEYKKKYNSDQPPSTHVKSYGTDMVAIKYLTKYLTKQNENRKIDGAQYRFSNKINCLFVPSVEMEPKKVNEFIDYLDRTAKNKYVNERFIVYYFEEDILESFDFLKQVPYLKSYYLMVYNMLYKSCLSYEYFELLKIYFKNAVNYRLFRKDMLNNGFQFEEFDKLMKVSMIV